MVFSQEKYRAKHRQRSSGMCGNQTWIVKNCLPPAMFLIDLKRPAAHRVADCIILFPCYELCECNDSLEGREMLECSADSVFFCVLSLSCSLQALFCPPSFLDGMLSNEALCWKCILLKISYWIIFTKIQLWIFIFNSNLNFNGNF